MQINQARLYISRIKNKAKRDYAEQYWLWLVGCLAELPDDSEISTMAGQAVRIWLRGFAEASRVHFAD